MRTRFDLSDYLYQCILLEVLEGPKSQLLSIAEKANPDWPELAVIKKSIAADRASKAANNPANQQV